MSKVLVDSIHQIANHIYKEKGYHITVKKSDVEVVFEALELFNQMLKERGNGTETVNQTKSM